MPVENWVRWPGNRRPRRQSGVGTSNRRSCVARVKKRSGSPNMELNQAVVANIRRAESGHAIHVFRYLSKSCPAHAEGFHVRSLHLQLQDNKKDRSLHE